MLDHFNSIHFASQDVYKIDEALKDNVFVILKSLKSQVQKVSKQMCKVHDFI